MKVVYPVVISKSEDWLIIHVPDLDADTQGEDLYDAIYMARDLISLCCVDMQDDGQELPTPTEISQVPHEEGDIVTLIDCNLDDYRKMINRMEIRRTVKIPGYLEVAARNAKINLSQTLQQALKAELGVE